jgi:hypothetical protein
MSDEALESPAGVRDSHLSKMRERWGSSVVIAPANIEMRRVGLPALIPSVGMAPMRGVQK